MKLYYDFHIHTALSPCGDGDMTPNNIVNMSMLKELDAIAITDHNTCGNAEAVMKVAEEAGGGLIVIPGMECETSEEIHVICLFPGLKAAKSFEALVHKHLPPLKNRKDIFGAQILYDAKDEAVGEEERMLLTATSLDLYRVIEEAKKLGGIAYPAHIDRNSYSIISSLGFIPEDLDINLIEISRNSDPGDYLEASRKVIPKPYYVMRSSDAHYLEDISERINFITMPEHPTAQSVIKMLKKL